MKSITRQRGMTLIGWIMTLTVIGFFALFAIRLTPVFLEYQSVVSSMNQLEELPAQASIVDIRRSLDKSLYINGVEDVEARDFDIRKEGGGTVVAIEYESRTGFIANIDLLVSFSHSVTVGSG